jgi:hypothetical protein
VPSFEQYVFHLDLTGKGQTDLSMRIVSQKPNGSFTGRLEEGLGDVPVAGAITEEEPASGFLPGSFHITFHVGFLLGATGQTKYVGVFQGIPDSPGRVFVAGTYTVARKVKGRVVIG